jgi:uncharacterized membrane protein YfcA
MTVLTFTLLVLCVSAVAGFLGSLTGLGGGVVIVPALVLLFKVDIRYAIGASLVSVIATSSGAAAAYIREGFTNIRIGMLLEIATTLGAISGAALAARVSTKWIAIIFGVVLIYSAIQSFLEKDLHAEGTMRPDPLATKLRLNGEYPLSGRMTSYCVQNVPAGFGMMFGAGTISGLLGIGSGALKVIAMDRAMKIPFKVSTTTSNFMIGVTAAASASVYLSRGYIQPGVAMPVMIGVLIGAFLGSKVLVRANVRVLRAIFGFVLLVVAVEMIYNGLTGRL